MLKLVCALILFLIFVVLSGFHFYWLFGGEWGVEKVIPTKNEDTAPPGIPKVATLIVAIGLATIGILYLIKSNVILVDLPEWFNYAFWIIPIIFTLRAIGDFKYVGFFKKIKNTKFAEADTRIFSPLCLLIGILGMLIQIL